MARMDDQRSKPRPIATVALLLIWLVFTFYVLSTGPSVWLRDHGYLSQESLEAIYFPLLLIGKMFTPFMNFIEWWISFFSA